MLAGLLSGFRSLRSMLLTGALLIGSVYVLIRGDSTSQVKLRSSAESLLDITPQMPTVLIVLACLLAGSLYVTFLEGVVDWIHRKLALVDRSSEANRLKRGIIGVFGPLSDAARVRLSQEAERFYEELVAREGDLIAAQTSKSAFVQSVLTDVLWMDGKLAGSPLRQSFDEFRAEGELRLGVGLLLPLGGMAGCYAVKLSDGWTAVAVVIAAGISMRVVTYGLYYYRRAHSFLAHHVADGVLLTPAMESLRRSAPQDTTPVKLIVVP